jgi:anhydro-N-acetylmuramic acid kinase
MDASARGTHFIGLMSGTSLDAVDGVLLSPTNTPTGPGWAVSAHAAEPLPSALRALFLSLNSPGPNELHQAAVAGHQLAHLYAQVCQRLLAHAGLSAADVAAIGAHGQTVRHHPPGAVCLGVAVEASNPNSPPYTLQINQPALLAELTGIPVVADFRSADIAAGGQGAPLVPVFHQAVFGEPGASVAVVNIGGIANITGLPAHGPVWGLDTGPGNMLLDLWCAQHTGNPYDANGAWGAQGSVSLELLSAFKADPYFARQGAKSTGRDLFNHRWLEGHLLALNHPLPASDVQATLVQLTVDTITNGLTQGDWGGTPPTSVWVCGGGALNGELMRGLQNRLPNIPVRSTAERGWSVDQVEAAAFAWLARARWLGEVAAGLPVVTGARGARCLGALYPARGSGPQGVRR